MAAHRVQTEPSAGLDHPHPHEAPFVPARGAILDIGGDIGAVLVNVGPALDGQEIELYDLDGGYLMHTEVHGRQVSQQGTARNIYAGLFPAVAQGRYLLETRDGSPRMPVVVSGGQVTTIER